MAMSMKTMETARNIRVWPSVTRRRVTAKDVLPNAAARMEKVSDTLLFNPMMTRCAGSISLMCLPKPREMLALTMAVYIRRKTWY